jgi:pimeloyl-ACP methyl ester carboxylesterase
VCAESNDIACGHLTVPLNPTQPGQGVITLALRRHRAPLGEAKDAVIALAGGPGQSAIPFLGTFDQLLGPIVATRDLIAFDQRGTGFSHPLSCAVFEHPRSGSPRTVGLCGGEIGEERGLFTTAQTVADIEDIREAGGYEKLVLYGTSYGTKVAERYAQEYPSHVEALVLDSVVPPNGPEAFERPTFAAVPRILRQLCFQAACAHITRNPVSDLGRLVRRMGGGAVHGTLIGRHGKAERRRISSNEPNSQPPCARPCAATTRRWRACSPTPKAVANAAKKKRGRRRSICRCTTRRSATRRPSPGIRSPTRPNACTKRTPP